MTILHAFPTDSKRACFALSLPLCRLFVQDIRGLTHLDLTMDLAALYDGSSRNACFADNQYLCLCISLMWVFSSLASLLLSFFLSSCFNLGVEGERWNENTLNNNVVHEFECMRVCVLAGRINNSFRELKAKYRTIYSVCIQVKAGMGCLKISQPSLLSYYGNQK